MAEEPTSQVTKSNAHMDGSKLLPGCTAHHRVRAPRTCPWRHLNMKVLIDDLLESRIQRSSKALTTPSLSVQGSMANMQTCNIEALLAVYFITNQDKPIPLSRHACRSSKRQVHSLEVQASRFSGLAFTARPGGRKVSTEPSPWQLLFRPSCTLTRNPTSAAHSNDDHCNLQYLAQNRKP